MAKKKEEIQDDVPDTDYNMEDDNDEMDVDTDFNVDDDYKPEPLVRGGTYKGNVSSVSRKGSRVIWKVVLAENGGYMSDGETEVDGGEYTFNNWLPKKTDRGERTKSGKDKWQTKVNMLKRFQDDLGVNMATTAQIDEAIEEMLWVGMPVSVTMKNETYRGMTTSRIDSMKKR